MQTSKLEHIDQVMKALAGVNPRELKEIIDLHEHLHEPDITPELVTKPLNKIIGEYVKAVVKYYDYNISRASVSLHVTRNTIYKYLKNQNSKD